MGFNSGFKGLIKFSALMKSSNLLWRNGEKLIRRNMTRNGRVRVVWRQATKITSQNEFSKQPSISVGHERYCGASPLHLSSATVKCYHIKSHEIKFTYDTLARIIWWQVVASVAFFRPFALNISLSPEIPPVVVPSNLTPVPPTRSHKNSQH